MKTGFPIAGALAQVVLPGVHTALIRPGWGNSPVPTSGEDSQAVPSRSLVERDECCSPSQETP